MSVILDDFTIRYGKATAVDHLSVQFGKGTTGLLGVNGAGKSSLIKGLLGLIPLAEGRATLLGKDIYAEGKTIRQLIGYMPEDDVLIPGLTGLKMVIYAGELAGMPRADAIQRAHEVLFATGLGEARYRKVESYSSGMKQRIKLAQAIVHDPQLLFLDEPTSGMDPKGRQEMLDLILEVAHRSNMNIILASHILVDVERTCQNVVMIHQGKLMESGELSMVRGAYTNSYSIRVEGNREAFESKLNTLGCTLEKDGEHLMDVTLPEKLTTSALFETADKTRTSIRRMIPSIQTLEDVFIKRLGDENAHL